MNNIKPTSPHNTMGISGTTDSKCEYTRMYGVTPVVHLYGVTPVVHPHGVTPVVHLYLSHTLYACTVSHRLYTRMVSHTVTWWEEKPHKYIHTCTLILHMHRVSNEQCCQVHRYTGYRYTGYWYKGHRLQVNRLQVRMTRMTRILSLSVMC